MGSLCKVIQNDLHRTQEIQEEVVEAHQYSQQRTITNLFSSITPIHATIHSRATQVGSLTRTLRRGDHRLGSGQ